MKQPKKSIHNFSLKAVAVLFAVFLWFYVDAQQNPLTEQRFDIPVDYINLTDDLSYTGGSNTVTVTIKGRRDRLNTIRSSDLTATVDMDTVTTGDNQLSVHVTAPTDVEIAAVRPSRMKLTVERQSTIQLPIQSQIIGTVAQGYSPFTPSLEPSTVTIQGAESLLAQLATAQVEIDISGATENILSRLPIHLLTKDGTPVETSALQLTPETVEVFLPIDQDMPSKTLPIKPNLLGQPAADYSVTRVSVVPETVKIVGSYNDIRTIDQLLTDPIDIEGLTEDLVQDVSLVIPENITLLSEPVVKIAVTIEPTLETKTIALPLTIQGETSYNVTLSQPTVRLTLSGTSADLADAEKLSSIVPFVDVSNLATGTHLVEVQLRDGQQLQVTAIQPTAIEAVLTDPLAADNPEIP